MYVCGTIWLQAIKKLEVTLRNEEVKHEDMRNTHRATISSLEDEASKMEDEIKAKDALLSKMHLILSAKEAENVEQRRSLSEKEALAQVQSEKIEALRSEVQQVRRPFQYSPSSRT